MSELLKRLQAQRDLHKMSLTTEKYGEICDLAAKAMLSKNWDSKLFNDLLTKVYEYGMHRKEYGYWDGAINAQIGFIEYSLDRVEAEQYAKAEADANQLDLLNPDKPDHPHDARCDGHGSG